MLLGYALFVTRAQWSRYYEEADCRVSPPMVVIGSDDWGGLEADETPADLDALASVLRCFTDGYGRHPVITVYMVSAVPDFQAIAASGFQKYLWRFCYEGRPEIVEKWKSLVREGLIDIEFHGREHYNVPLWMTALKDDVPGFREGCRQGNMGPMTGPGGEPMPKVDPRFRWFKRSFIDASVYPPRALCVDAHREMIATGLEIIRQHFGVSPEAAVAPGLVWDTNTWQALESCGISYIETADDPIVTVDSKSRLKPAAVPLRWSTNDYGVRPIIRNCSYEPGVSFAPSTEEVKEVTPGPEEVSDALQQIRRSLFMGCPAVLQTHSFSYRGEDQARKDAGLRGLKCLLATTLSEFPGAAFLSAPDLGHYIHGTPGKARRPVDFIASAPGFVGRAETTAVCLWTFHRKLPSLVVIFLGSAVWTVASTARWRRLLAGQDR